MHLKRYSTILCLQLDLWAFNCHDNRLFSASSFFNQPSGHLSVFSGQNMVLLFNYLLKVLFLLSILLCYFLSPAYSNMMWRSFDQQLEDEPLRGNSSFSYNDDRTMFLLSAQAAQAPTSVQQNGNTSALLPTPKSFNIGTLKVALDKGTSHM